MDFQIERLPNHDRSVSLKVYAVYTDEEAGALTHFDAWENVAIPKLTVWLGLWKSGESEVTFHDQTFSDFVHPGILIEDFIPVQADKFESNFRSTYGHKIEKKLGGILKDFRSDNHRLLQNERDAYFDKKPRLPYEPQRYLPKK